LAFAGALVGSSLVQGEPYTAHLVSIDGYIRGSLLNNDTAMMIVETYLGGATSTAVAFGALMWGPADLSASWVPLIWLWSMKKELQHQIVLIFSSLLQELVFLLVLILELLLQVVG
jgi:hypothetical protein